jgi:hypothetical protein
MSCWYVQCCLFMSGIFVENSGILSEVSQILTNAPFCLHIVFGIVLAEDHIVYK